MRVGHASKVRRNERICLGELSSAFVLHSQVDVALLDGALLLLDVSVVGDARRSVGRGSDDGHAGQAETAVLDRSADDGVLDETKVLGLCPLLNDVTGGSVVADSSVVSDLRLVDAQHVCSTGNDTRAKQDEALWRAGKFAETIQLRVELGIGTDGGERLFLSVGEGDVGTKELDARGDAELTHWAVGGNAGVIESLANASDVLISGTIVDQTRHEELTLGVVDLDMDGSEEVVEGDERLVGGGHGHGEEGRVVKVRERIGVLVVVADVIENRLENETVQDGAVLTTLLQAALRLDDESAVGTNNVHLAVASVGGVEDTEDTVKFVELDRVVDSLAERTVECVTSIKKRADAILAGDNSRVGTGSRANKVAGVVHNCLSTVVRSNTELGASKNADSLLVFAVGGNLAGDLQERLTHGDRASAATFLRDANEIREGEKFAD